MTTTNRFQPGDKVRVGLTRVWAADLGLDANATYTVAHVDDFGQIALLDIGGYFHPSHFELVERAASAPETCYYSLKDGEGDWWFFDNEDGYWYMVDGHLTLFSLLEGAEDIAVQYGIDAEPLPSVAGVDVPDSCSECASYDPNTGLHWDTCPNRGAVHLGSSDAAIAAMTTTGNSTGPSLHFEADPAPLQPGDAVLVWAKVRRAHESHAVVDLPGDENVTPASNVAVVNDAIVRPAEGQVPPWHSPKPAEPTGRGAFVVDTRGREWVRVDTDGQPWRRVGALAVYSSWGDLDIPADGVEWEGMQ